ncbi:MAG: DUF2391 family protein [Candidatus Woesearchaeota archaeon]
MTKKALKKKNSKIRPAAKKNLSKKLDKVIALENKLLHEELKIEKEENNIKKEENIENKKENRIERVLEKEESDLERLEKIEKEIKAEVGEHPLAKVTFKDITKGLIGAFIGLAIHYTFVYGVKISEGLTMTRATILYPLTFLVGLLFIYATGFRKVQDKKILVYMPVRLFVLYMCALVMSILVLYLFYPTFGHEFEESYKMVAGVMLAAVVGACTADLLGKE